MVRIMTLHVLMIWLKEKSMDYSTYGSWLILNLDFASLQTKLCKH